MVNNLTENDKVLLAIYNDFGVDLISDNLPVKKECVHSNCLFSSEESFDELAETLGWKLT